VVAEIRTGASKVIHNAGPMFEMWSSVTSKLEVSQQQQQQQQPHTSSGSIKGSVSFSYSEIRFPFFSDRNVETNVSVKLTH
jgi:hypothetical protein